MNRDDLLRNYERDDLLRNYEETVHKQAALLKRQQATLDSLQEELSSQQAKTSSALRQHTSKLTSLMQQVQTDAAQDTQSDIALLKKELETALKEKELTQAENKRQALEIQRLRGEIGSALPNRGETSQIKYGDEYVQVVKALEEEVERLRTELEKVDEEKLQITKLNFDLRRNASLVEESLEKEKDQRQALQSFIREETERTREAKESFTALSIKFQEQSEDMRTLMAQTKALQKSKDQLTKIVCKVKERLKEGEIRVAESVRVAEDALVEKDAALLREKHSVNEVDRLEKTVKSLLEEAGQKAKSEVTKVKDDYNNTIKTMSQEIARLEMALNEKDMQCSRRIQECKKIASEGERLQTEIDHRKNEHEQEILNLHDRINSLEAKIASLSAERDKMSTQHTHSEQEYEQQRGELLVRIQELEQRLTSCRSDCETLRLALEQAKFENNSLLTKFEKAKEHSEQSEKLLKRELRLKSEEAEDLSASIQTRIDASDASHRDLITQLYENITTLQENHSKLQSHMASQKEEYEQRISDISRRLQVNQKESKQLTQSLHQANTNLAVTKDLTSQYKKRISEVESRLYAAEQRFSTLRMSQSSVTGGLDDDDT